MWRCSDELKQRVVILEAHHKKEAKHYIEFWKHIPPSEPFRVLLGDMRDKLYNTRERMRQLLANGKSDINIEDTFTDASQV
jgi:phosphoenolpyruvate carboxylase